MALEDHYYQPREEFFEMLEREVRSLSRDQLMRAQYIFSDELKRRIDERDYKEEIQRVMQAENFDDFVLRARISLSERIRSMSIEELQEAWDAREQSVREAF